MYCQKKRKTIVLLWLLSFCGIFAKEEMDFFLRITDNYWQSLDEVLCSEETHITLKYRYT